MNFKTMLVGGQHNQHKFHNDLDATHYSIEKSENSQTYKNSLFLYCWKNQKMHKRNWTSMSTGPKRGDPPSRYPLLLCRQPWRWTKRGEENGAEARRTRGEIHWDSSPGSIQIKRVQLRFHEAVILMSIILAHGETNLGRGGRTRWRPRYILVFRQWLVSLWFTGGRLWEGRNGWKEGFTGRDGNLVVTGGRELSPDPHF
jgi:hypothetical protein